MLATAAYPLYAVRQQIIGLDTPLPRSDGSSRPSINLDNAATTPALRQVHATVERFLSWYGGLHRGAGHKSQVASAAYAEARAVVGGFVGARAGQHAVIITRNTTEALNLLARRLDLRPGELIVSTELEHRSNDLPWRQVAPVLRARATPAGALDEEHLAALLRRHAGRARLLAVTGGSNVTGYIPPVHQLAELAHAYGAEIVVDAAQLAPHRPIDMGDLGDPAHLDYVAFSGHKLYAPYGAGALVGRADRFAYGAPLAAGGAAHQATAQTVAWGDDPARDEAGTPNAVGAVALAAACLALADLGRDAIAAREAELTARALERLAAVPGVSLYGAEAAEGRLGVIPFAVAGYDPHLVAAILSHEHGIAVHAGCFCAQPYVRRLLDSAAAGCGHASPGLLRASLGIYTADFEVDLLAESLARITSGDHGAYVSDRRGGYVPHGWEAGPPSLFQREGPIARATPPQRVLPAEVGLTSA